MGYPAVVVASLRPLMQVGDTKAMLGQSLTVTDDKDNDYDGRLSNVEEKDDQWSLDVPTDAGRFNFVSSETPVVKVPLSPLVNLSNTLRLISCPHHDMIGEMA